MMDPGEAHLLKTHRRRVWARKPFPSELPTGTRVAKEGPSGIKVERSP